jgi:hypothetical protein
MDSGRQPRSEPFDYHLQCPSGLAGDMFLGACLDLGMPLAVIADAVAKLELPGVTVEARKARRGGLAGTRFRVLLDGEPVEGPDPEEAEGARRDDPQHAHGHAHGSPPDTHSDHDAEPANPTAGHHRGELLGGVAGHAGHAADSHHHGGHGRSLASIERLIGESALDDAVKERSLRLFRRLGEAEAGAHGVPVESVHFHELGAVDSIVDLVGAAAAVEHLRPARLTCGRVNVGGGTTATAHGLLPVPPPAAAALLAGVPVYGGGGGELVTPTGAVLLAELVDAFEELPPMALEGTGLGHGRREIAGWPNSARLVRGRRLGASVAAGRGRVTVVESEIDDLPGEGFGHLMERLLEAGALDAYFTPVQMKKSRPGILVTLLCRPERLEELAALLLAESGALGCRYHEAWRLEAERETAEVATRFGAVRVKRARLGGRPLASAPEYEDCRRLAREAGVPWREVYGAALAALAAPGAEGGT